MPEGSKVQKMFASIAGRYDLANGVLSFGTHRYWRWVLGRKVRKQRPADLVDLATGSGDVAFALGRVLDAEVKITGMDFCEPMLEAARAKQERLGKGERVVFRFGDCMELPLEDASVDAVTIAFGVRNFEDRQKGLGEIRRVLRPGGKVYILEFSQPYGWFRPLYYAYLRYVLPKLAACLTGNKAAYDYLGDTIGGFPAHEELSEELEAAGFRAPSCCRLTQGIVALHEARA